MASSAETKAWSPETAPGAWERRRIGRTAAYGARVRAARHEVRLLNLSEDGLAVEGARRLTAGRRYRFTLRGDSGSSASFQGEVLWCRRVARPGGPSVYRAGIRRLGGAGVSGAG